MGGCKKQTMKEIKSVKSFLKICIAISNMTRDELKGIRKLTEKEYDVLGNIRADVQNELGENYELLEKYKLKK